MVGLALLGACSGSPAEVVDVRFDMGDRAYVVSAEVADETSEQRRGLMGRTSLAPDTGMLFVWDDVEARSFWMKDTLIALDLIAIRSGRVVSVDQMVPCEADPCPFTVTAPADAALEVEAGTAARAGIEPGVLVAAEVLR